MIRSAKYSFIWTKVYLIHREFTIYSNLYEQYSSFSFVKSLNYWLALDYLWSLSLLFCIRNGAVE